MRWIEFIIALLAAAIFATFRVFREPWCDEPDVQFGAVLFIFLTAAIYIAFVDDERRPRVGTKHRLAVGTLAGAGIAAVLNSPVEGYFLGITLGAILGYIGIYWVKFLEPGP